MKKYHSGNANKPGKPVTYHNRKGRERRKITAKTKGNKLLYPRSEITEKLVKFEEIKFLA